MVHHNSDGRSSTSASFNFQNAYLVETAATPAGPYGGDKKPISGLLIIPWSSYTVCGLRK